MNDPYWSRIAEFSRAAQLRARLGDDFPLKEVRPRLRCRRCRSRHIVVGPGVILVHVGERIGFARLALSLERGDKGIESGGIGRSHGLMTVRMTVCLPDVSAYCHIKQYVARQINVIARYIDRILQSSAALRKG